MAHPPYGSAQKGRTRFALYCVAVILRRFLCQGTYGAAADPFPLFASYHYTRITKYFHVVGKRWLRNVHALSISGAESQRPSPDAYEKAVPSRPFHLRSAS